MIVLYYLSTVLIWGSTWIVITFQLGAVPPALSVAYRFFLSALITYVYLRLRGPSYRLSLKQHGWVALQGLCLFGLNYVLTYHAEQKLSSGLVAVLFSLIVPLNIMNSRIFFKKALSFRVVAGAILGLVGISFVFQHEVETVSNLNIVWAALLMCLCATYSASLGNMIALRNKISGIPILVSNTMGMLYGSILSFTYAVMTGPITFEPTLSYIGSLLYLTVFGSILAFFFYITLVTKIGADRASYASVVFPIVALILSTFFEGYQWSLSAAFGIALILLGNVLVLAKFYPGWPIWQSGLRR